MQSKCWWRLCKWTHIHYSCAQQQHLPNNPNERGFFKSSRSEQNLNLNCFPLFIYVLANQRQECAPQRPSLETPPSTWTCHCRQWGLSRYPALRACQTFGLFSVPAWHALCPPPAYLIEWPSLLCFATSKLINNNNNVSKRTTSKQELKRANKKSVFYTLV